MLERIGAAAIVLGMVLALCASAWLSWRMLRALFGKAAWSGVKKPLGLLLIAIVMMAAPIAVNSVLPIDLGPHEQTVAGEIHLTLTGWDRKDYDRVLAARSQAVVVQMANADVTDETLKLLTALPNLRELDVNDSQLTDAGLATLAALPRLEILRLARTKITDDGFRRHLLAKASLKQLDLTGTDVASKTVREWKANQEGRQALK